MKITFCLSCNYRFVTSSCIFSIAGKKVRKFECPLCCLVWYKWEINPLPFGTHKNMFHRFPWASAPMGIPYKGEKMRLKHKCNKEKNAVHVCLEDEHGNEVIVTSGKKEGATLWVAAAELRVLAGSMNLEAIKKETND